MSDFDYERAHAEAAVPAFNEVSVELSGLNLQPRYGLFTLLGRIRDTALDVSQRPDTSLPWPDDGGHLQTLFRAVCAQNPEGLARAAKATYNAGHWAPHKSDFAVLQFGGLYWRFARYADNTLAEHFAIGRSTGHDHDRCGLRVYVMDGTVCIGVNSPSYWSWQSALRVRIASAPRGRCARRCPSTRGDRTAVTAGTRSGPSAAIVG